MERDSTVNRKTQAIILIVSSLIIIWGIYKIATGHTADLFTMTNTGTEYQTHANGTFILLFVLAIIMAFFSGRNLMKSRR